MPRMIRDVDRPRIVSRTYPGYPALNCRRVVGPYTIVDYGWAKSVWRHGWREDRNESRNVCRRLREPGRLPA